MAADNFPIDVWGAKLLESDNAPKLYEMLQALCDRADMDVPTVFSIPRSEPNAFAFSRREGGPAIVITNGLTRHLEREEVEAVMALMIARLATDVMVPWTMTATIAGLFLQIGINVRRHPQVEWLGTLVLTLLAYPAAGAAWLGFNEGVILAADHHAAHLAEQPSALRTALAKIERGQTEELMTIGNPATAMLFAVPPIPIPTNGTPFWQRALSVFPYRSPNAAARAARILSIAPTSFDEPPSQATRER